MPARSCKRNDILDRRDNPVTRRRQITSANNLREYHMTANHLSRTANDFLRRNDFPGNAEGRAEKNSMRIAPPDLAGVNSATAIIAITDKVPAIIVARPNAGRRKTTFWSSVLDYLIESFALYGASMHAVAFFAVGPGPDEERTPQLKDISSRERRGPAGLIAPVATEHVSSPEPDRRFNHVTPAGHVIAFADDSSRERERKIKTTIAELAKLDDRTLLDMGIPHRTQIEQVVRYCHDC
jgi:uncharacterized protein YjiS (DUF1127 family)